MDSSRRGQGKSVKTRVVYVDRPERTERKPERRTERRKSIHATRPSEQKPTKPRKWLGDGGFADVYSETDPTTRQKFAVKVFKSKREIATATDLSENELKSRIRREIQILQSLSNGPHIVRYLSHHEINGRTELYMTYYRSNLSDTVKNYRSRTDSYCPPFLDTAMQQVTQGVAYIHSKRIVHCDLKPENILCDSERDFQIADFGCAVYAGKFDELGGTRHFAAPELYEDNVAATTKCDIWSLGIIALDMFGGVTDDIDPEQGRKQYFNYVIRMAEKIHSLTFPVQDALRYAMHDRYSAQKILNEWGSSSSQRSTGPSIDSANIREIRPRSTMARHSTSRRSPPRTRVGGAANMQTDDSLGPGRLVQPHYEIRSPRIEMRSPKRRDWDEDEYRPRPPPRDMQTSRANVVLVEPRDPSMYGRRGGEGGGGGGRGTRY